MAGTKAIRTNKFVNSIGVNTHMSYTDGAYANVANVEADLAYLGITHIRDGVPNANGGVPSANQVTALETLAAAGIKFDLVTSPDVISITQTMQEIEALDAATPGCVIAVEGANEINNQPVTYDGLTGQAAAVAFQKALYTAIKNDPATSGIAVYDFTGGLSDPLTIAGAITRNKNGSYTLTNGQTGFPVTLPPGISTITMTYTGAAGPASGIFGYPGAAQQSSIVYGANGQITYTFDNTTGAAEALYVDFIDYGQTATLTGVDVTGPGSHKNVVKFDPDQSLSGQADYANIHPYSNDGGPLGPLIASNFETAYGTATPGKSVITESGYNTDPNASNGVSQLVQAQLTIGGLLEAYQDGVSETYLYELLDEKADPDDTDTGMHYGLFSFGNTPKMAATAIHNLTTILADTGSDAATFKTGKLDYSIAGATAADHSLLMESSNKVFDLALWNDADAGTSNADSLTISLGKKPENVNVYDVVTGAETSYTGVTSVAVSLGGDPLILQISPKITPANVLAASQMSFVSSGTVTSTSSATAPKIVTGADVTALLATPTSALLPSTGATADADSLKSTLNAGAGIAAALLTRASEIGNYGALVGAAALQR
jgi:hypothetical protein